MRENPDLRVSKLESIWDILTYRPALGISIVILGIVTAILEGIGLSFIIPIVESINGGTANESSGTTEVLGNLYGTIGIPYTIEYIILGVIIILFARFTASFTVSWLRALFRTNYICHLRTESFNRLLEGKTEYFDTKGADEIVNTIITETFYAGEVILYMVQIMQNVLLSVVYLAIALYIAPIITVLTAVGFGVLTYIVRNILESGYSIGQRVGEANEGLQRVVQAAVHGIRDVKSFRLGDELRVEYDEELDQYRRDRIKAQRNVVAIKNYYNFATVITVFLLIYISLTFTDLSIGELSIFLLSMFRLGPRLSQVNDKVYHIESKLPHLVQVRRFISELQEVQEPDSGSMPVPEPMMPIKFHGIGFSYGKTSIIHNLSFTVDANEFVAFVGSSGAGKSTIASLLMRLYDPESGEITANGTPLTDINLDAWRSRVSIVRQDPYIFNDTLWNNLTIAKRDATEAEVRESVEIAQVTTFLDELSDGYDTQLGQDGVRLSGGQKQRVAIARALLKEAKLLILDEATSDLDSNLEEKVHQGIEGMERDCALVVIAHRLSTVKDADQILTLADGQIVERGTHQELMEDYGAYAELYQLQSQNVGTR